MKYLASILLVFAILAAPFSFFAPVSGATASAPAYSGYPTFSISSVVVDKSVKIVTKNLPPNDTFDVLMNYMGTRGVNGIKVATLNTANGGTQTLTYTIPAALVGQYQIAIRLQSTSGSGYFAYNWFYNKTSTSSGGTGGTGYSGYPTFSIQSVVMDTSVTIVTNNLPPNDTFNVLMNYMGTRGVNGIKVATLNTANGGTQTLKYTIPAALVGQYQIAIRLQSTSGSGYFAYNWFYNNTSSIGTGGTGGTTSGYSGFPYMVVKGVVRNTSVTVRIKNLPPNDEFKVLMGYMGTAGINGIKVTSIDTNSGGDQKFTFTIPAALAGQSRIAIRIQSKTGSGYFAYNWFYNSTTP